MNRLRRFFIGLAIEVLQEVIHLFVPPGPIVIHVVAPEIDPGRDRPFPKNGFQVAGVGNGFLFPGTLAYTDNDRVEPVALQIPGIAESGKIA